MARTSLIKLARQQEASERQARIYRRAAELLETELARATDALTADVLTSEVERFHRLEDELLADASMLKVAQADYIATQLARYQPE